VLAASVVLLGTSMIVNIVFLILVKKDAEVSGWVREYPSIGSALLISSKSLGAFNIAGSRILNLRFLEAPISAQFSDRLTLFGVSQTVLEDLPQIAIQVYTAVVLQTWSTSVLLSLISGIFNITFKVLVWVILLVVKNSPASIEMSNKS